LAELATHRAYMTWRAPTNYCYDIDSLQTIRKQGRRFEYRVGATEAQGPYRYPTYASLHKQQVKVSYCDVNVFRRFTPTYMMDTSTTKRSGEVTTYPSAAWHRA